ncbi:MAG TPA: hypothetical protein V6D34_15240 [Candidatus Sericytochromatia bacterium]
MSFGKHQILFIFFRCFVATIVNHAFRGNVTELATATTLLQWL